MNQSPLVVSYYTEGTPYEKEAQDLKASCEKFNLEYEILPVPNLGSWSANCCHKAEFLLKKLEEHKRPLIWTDADSVFMQTPKLLLECHADVALRINDYVEINDKAKILTGTMFFNNTASSKKLLQLWKKECEKLLQNSNTIVFDQVALRKVVLHYPTIVEMKRLPISYVFIVDNPEDKNRVHSDVVVAHYQASRINQKIIDGELVSTLVDNLSSAELKDLRTK